MCACGGGRGHSGGSSDSSSVTWGGVSDKDPIKEHNTGPLLMTAGYRWRRDGSGKVGGKNRGRERESICVPPPPNTPTRPSLSEVSPNGVLNLRTVSRPPPCHLHTVPAHGGLSQTAAFSFSPTSSPSPEGSGPPMRPPTGTNTGSCVPYQKLHLRPASTPVSAPV
uniref:Uncharacterized protein n=1 Tax=Knipowitschia caucasica TaxID=637954 RepID=A0AAV2LBQ9_KNICA